jgi:hypothetical protein
MFHTIELDVAIVLPKNVGLRFQKQDGKLLVIRKNPHVIVAGLGQDTLANYWFIMWMAINTTQDYAI